ncbi:MAG TPA: triose-phosphate isomerase [Geminicoccus sp.]|jgi:triosephosphate isomerase|uniref:triose-phosphate isomerase n=1 Tax=Geminicoccus sp. TaxID=2024832 RepID=UPI002E379689|nr:triose-phosphate isomerase [Geminicoccus sp.]HEX2527681.1 triose-phosphate isomerase [Geminicoccus sp.]
MPGRRPLVFGNWKMNGLGQDTRALSDRLKAFGPITRGTLGVFPPFTQLQAVAEKLRGSGIVVGAQDCHEAANGAYTGSVSAAMVADTGATAVILGHSERRHGLGESDALVNAKAKSALDAGLALLVICIGETESEYLDKQTLAVLDRQVEGSIPADIDPDRLVVAYEPVWAIGTGRTPSREEIASVHAHLRGRLAAHLKGDGRSVAIQYGGSVKGANAPVILGIADVDGALVGGASLDPVDFAKIFTAGGGSFAAPGS